MSRERERYRYHYDSVPNFYPPPIRNELPSTERPRDTTFLDRGYHGQIFITPNGMAIYKICNRDSQTHFEYQMLLTAAILAPQYVPAPIALVSIDDTTGRSVAIQMMNAGKLLWGRGRPLEPLEIGLCMLQVIHFALLIGDAILFNDAGLSNMCVRLSGEHIQLRLIDSGLWMDGLYKSNTFQNNLTDLLRPFGEYLRRASAATELAEALHGFYNDLPPRPDPTALRVLEAHLCISLTSLAPARVRELDREIQPLLAAHAGSM